MKYEVQLSNDRSYVLDGANIDIDEITKSLNVPSINFINFAGVLINKSILLGIFPMKEEK